MSSAQPLSSSGNVSAEERAIAAARKGDVGAFNQLVALYQDLAYTVAVRLVGDRDTANDVCQEAFFSAFRNLRQFHGGSFRSWLLRIVTNASYDVLRSRKRHDTVSIDGRAPDDSFDERSAFGDPVVIPDDAALPEDLAQRGEFFRVVEEGLKSLPVEQRAVLVLYDVHGFSYEEVATTLGTNLGTVKSRLSRARGRLRDYLVRHPELWRAEERL
ncbi:MAG TPA: sigma-70 family RNA polymerase sigma factor [Chloroflexota bacterium]|nr:sigma-70 family RNA polymerase sigma factor [Chloroflexota bacterium]